MTQYTKLQLKECALGVVLIPLALGLIYVFAKGYVVAVEGILS